MAEFFFFTDLITLILLISMTKKFNCQPGQMQI